MIKSSPPLKRLTIDITQKSFPKIELPFNLIEKAIEQFSNLGGKTLEISGEEPPYHPHLIESINLAKGYRLKVYLHIRGFFLPKEHLISSKITNRIVKRLAKSKIDGIFVNLKGANSKIHDELTSSKGSFKTTIRFIKRLIRHGLNVGIEFIPMNLNFEQIDDVFDFSKILGVSELLVLGDEGTQQLSKDELWHLIQLLSSYVKSSELKVKLGCSIDFCFIFNKYHNPVNCTAGLDKCEIMPDGKVIPCSAFRKSRKYVAGDINESTLPNVWVKSETFKLLRKFNYKLLKGKCQTCSFIDLCKGRCVARRVKVSGNIYVGSDPNCPLINRSPGSKLQKVYL